MIIFISILLALCLRLSLFHFQSLDFINFLDPWYNFILENGRFAALKHNFANYNPPYLYLMVLATYVFPGFPNIVAIKLISIAFDFFGAFWVYKIVKLKYPKGKKPIFAFIALLFAPTIFINSSYWGQCDMIYTSWLLACIYFFCIEQDFFALVAFSLALTFKLQALFLGPLILILWFKKAIDWKSFLLIPSIFLLALIPAWVIGRPWQELTTIYFNQGNTYQNLTKNAPNLYQWISDDYYSIVVPIGLIFTILLIGLISLAVTTSKVDLSKNKALIIELSLISSLIMPYFLPKMHERYFFIADVLSIVFTFYFPKYWFVPLLIISTSLLSYIPFLLGRSIVSFYVLSLILAILIIVVLYHFKKSLNYSAKS